MYVFVDKKTEAMRLFGSLPVACRAIYPELNGDEYDRALEQLRTHFSRNEKKREYSGDKFRLVRVELERSTRKIDN